jgi:hypothetical protein
MTWREGMTYVMHSISQMDVKAREEENRLSPLLLRVPGKREREGGRGMEGGREGGRENGLAGFPFETTKQSPRVGEVAAAIIIHTRIAWSM